MADLATVLDVAGAWRVPNDAEITKIQSLLRFASARVRNKVPGIDARLQAGSLDRDLVTGIVAEMVARVMRNPEGYREVEVDDVRRVRDTTLSSGQLVLLDSELAELTDDRGGAFTIRPVGRPDRGAPSAWWPL